MNTKEKSRQRLFSFLSINDLCRILKCSIPDICVYVESKDDQKL